MNEESLIGLFVAMVSFGALLYLAALGELIAEKAGILNLGVEGMMAIGAVTAFIAGAELNNPWIALLIAMIAGAILATVHGLFTVGLGAEQVVSGLALTILGLGLAAYLGKDYVGRTPGAELVPVDWGALSDLPWVGPILFAQAPLVYIAILFGVTAAFVLGKTRVGLALRAAGESASSADSAGPKIIKKEEKQEASNEKDSEEGKVKEPKEAKEAKEAKEDKVAEESKEKEESVETEEQKENPKDDSKSQELEEGKEA